MPLPGWGLPAAMGVEGAGRVEAVGDGVENLAPGDRVAWFYHPGSYADLAAVRAESLVKIPEAVDDQTAAAVMMQGLTAHHLVTETYPVEVGDTAVVLAAARGVGLLLTQMVKAMGGRAIGLVSHQDKAPAALATGADHVLVSSRGGFQDQVRELTGGRGTDVVYDGGGTDTFRSSQLALRRHGVHAFLGNLIGNPTLNPTDLPASIKLTYPVVFDHVPDPAPLRRRAGEVFDLVAAGILRPRIGARYPLADAAKAHADLASRRTVGKLLLLP
jgi:NADPH:quinone reductase-like Zn-dependent oxidoreductase